MLVLGKFGNLTGLFEGFQDAKSHEGDDALAIWWMLPYFYTMVVFVTALAGYAIDEFGVTFAVSLAFPDVGDGFYWLTPCF
jgi:hypothetical protein